MLDFQIWSIKVYNTTGCVFHENQPYTQLTEIVSFSTNLC